MFWIAIARIFVPGAILGIIVGKIVAGNPHYIELLRPHFWVSRAKKANRDQWLRLLYLAIIFAVLAYFLVGYILEIIEARWGWVLISKEEYIIYKLAKISIPLLFISVTLLPIFEEWIFRSILLEEIAQRSNSRWIGLLASSVIFAAFHLSNPGTYPAAMIPMTAGGLILGGCYLAGGLSTSILSHSLYNIMLILLSIL